MLSDRQTVSLTSSQRAIPPTWKHQPAAGKPAVPASPGLLPTEFTVDAGTDLITSTAHGLAPGWRIQAASDGTLPAGLTAGADLFVIATGLTADDFKVSASYNGTAVNITSAGTGTHTWTLHPGAIAEVNEYLASCDRNGPHPPDPVHASAAAIIAARTAYHDSPAYMTWWHDNFLTREAQWMLRLVDVNVASDATVAISAAVDGIGAAPPTSPIPAYVPPTTPQVEQPVGSIATGSLGGSITFGIICDTIGAIIHYALNGGALTNYTAPISMVNGESVVFYATKAGYLDSDQDSFENTV